MNSRIDKDLHLDDGSKLQWFHKNYKDFLNKTTIIYGRRESGKSTLVLEIMYLLKDRVSIPFIVSQSNASDYVDKVPRNCIKTDITKEWLEEFLSVQKGRADIYNRANDIRILKTLFDKVKNSQMDNVEKLKCSSAEKYIRSIESNPRLDYSTKRERIKAIQDIRYIELIDLYKSVIRMNKHTLISQFDRLSRDEICCFNYLDYQPHALLILDDCASKLKKWVKESTIIKEIFYNGRHSYITFIITTQDDKEIESELRKNAMVSIFTTQQAATANFGRASNAYPKHEKNKAELCTKRIFHNDLHKNGLKIKNHKKMVYIQNKEDPFMYMIAEIYDNFTIGCPSLWALDEKLEETKAKNDDDSVWGFFNRYYNV